MTTYDDRHGPLQAGDDTQVQQTLPSQRTGEVDRSESTEATYGFQPPVASNDYPAEVLQRKRFGGTNWGAGFYGWLVTLAMATLLTAGAAAVVLGLGAPGDAVPVAGGSATNGFLLFGATGLGIVMLAYFCGGYVAGRMSRFDGGRQGLAVWVVGLLLTGAAAGLGLVFGPHVTLPDLPAPALTASATGITVLVAVVVGALGGLVAALLGGKLGCRYHRKVDDAAFV